MTYIGVRAAARILGVHENTVRNYMRRGWLTYQGLPVGGRYTHFDEAEVSARPRRRLKLANRMPARPVASMNPGIPTR